MVEVERSVLFMCFNDNLASFHLCYSLLVAVKSGFKIIVLNFN